jgi:hypothetical protein
MSAFQKLTGIEQEIQTMIFRSVVAKVALP